jgi:hypothetical protein
MALGNRALDPAPGPRTPIDRRTATLSPASSMRSTSSLASPKPSRALSSASRISSTPRLVPGSIASGGLTYSTSASNGSASNLAASKTS